jgi:putative tricarboxylic transport membrane protein
MSDRIFCAIFLVVLACLAWVAWKIDAPFSYEPIGPKAYPLLLFGLMAACAAWILVKPDAKAEWPEAKSLRLKVAGLLGVLLAWALLFHPLGFIVSTALASVAIGRLFDAAWKPNLVAGVVSSVALYFFFDKLLDVALPLGRLWGA